MRTLLLQLDSSRLPSVFDRVVAYDAGADEVLSYGGIAEADVRDLIHGCIFTRGPKDLKHTAVFIGGTDMAAGEVRGQRAVVVAGTGPVGLRAAGLLAKAGAEVVITSRKPDAGERARQLVTKRFGGTVRALPMADAREAARALEGAALVLNAGPAGVQLVPQAAWAKRPGLKAAADVNAVPPLGIEGIETMDDGAAKQGVACFGALAIGNLKMKIHKACVARLFERNDLVLDAETIADVARELLAPQR